MDNSIIEYRIKEINYGIDSSEESFVTMAVGKSKYLNIEKAKLRMIAHAYEIEHESVGSPMVHGVRQAIITKVLGPTNSKGMRHKASTSGGAKSITKDYHAYDNREVAQMLADVMGWGDVVIGTAIDTQGTVAWVCEDNR